MDFNRITADLTYLGSTIREIKVNNHIVSLGDDVSKEFGFDFEVIDVEASETERSGRILMQVSVFLTFADDEKDEFTMTLEGVFTAPIRVAEEEFIKLLTLNGATALYSIARARLETISATTFMNGKIILPMINILTFIEEKIAKSSEMQDK